MRRWRRTEDSDDLSAAARRRRRRGVGLLDDDLSSTVLGWRLPLTGDGPSAQLGRLADGGGQPALWTLAQLRADPPAARPDVPVLVVENPSVLATAALVRVDIALLCTAGVPSVAAGVLLAALAVSGCPLLVHADFDPHLPGARGCLLRALGGGGRSPAGTPSSSRSSGSTASACSRNMVARLIHAS